MDFKKITARAKHYESKMVSFLRDLVAIPSESSKEGPVIARIKKEMQATKAFDRVWTDPMGNIFGRVGRGKKIIAIDAHVDTVGIGNPKEWKHDPYKGKVAGGKVWGRGAGDQEGAIPAMVYSAKIMRDLKLPLDEFSLYVVCTVMEEDCDGLCWQYIVNEDGLKPDVVVVTDSTDCRGKLKRSAGIASSGPPMSRGSAMSSRSTSSRFRSRPVVRSTSPRSNR